MESKQCIRATVEGNVQNVGFRAATQKIAQKHGITGQALNLADGSVEITACGEEDSIAKLVKWLHHGPDGAKVAGVTVETVYISTPTKFTTG